jgi:hypothetical protein
MTRLGPLVVSLVLGACTGTPRAEELAIDESELIEERKSAVLPNAQVVRTREPAAPELDAEDDDEPAPSRAALVPRLEVNGTPGDGACPDIDFHGLPAVDVHGTTIVFGGWDYPGTVVAWLDVDSGERLENISMFSVLDPTDEESPCAASAWREARRKAAEINARLRDGWRSMDTLPVAVDTASDGPSELLEIPPAQRPIELAVRGGEIVLRIPGVRVLTRIPLSGERQAWLYDPLQGDVHHAKPESVFADEATGVALIEVRYEMMCWDSHHDLEPVRLSPDVFARVRAYPYPSMDDDDDYE